MKKGMQLIVLDILNGESLHGYAIAEKISSIYGIKRPSSGIIYPTLQFLTRRSLVRVCGEGKRAKKIYEITDAGREYLFGHRKELETAKRTLKNIGEFQRLGGSTLMSELEQLIKIMHKLSSEEKAELREVLHETSKKIRKITGEKYDE